MACMDTRGTVDRIYKEDHYTLLHTKYESSVPFGFAADFLCFSRCKSMGANDPRGGAIFDPRGMVGRIYKEDHYTSLHTKRESSGPCGFGEDFFYVFPMVPLGRGLYGPPGARLAGFMKRTTIHCYTQNMKALGLVVLEKKIFLCFSHCKSMGAICCHGNQSSNPTCPKTLHNLSPSSMMLKIKFDYDRPCCLRDI